MLDSLGEFARAVLSFLETGQAQTARFCSEPDRIDVEVGPGASVGPMRVEVRGRFVHEGDAKRLSLASWRSFRRLESQFEPSHWAHAFPAREVEAPGGRSRPRSGS